MLFDPGITDVLRNILPGLGDFSTEPHEGQKWRLVLRAVIGLILVVGLILGLSPILPSEEIWLRMIRYCIAILVGIFVWPCILKKANL